MQQGLCFILWLGELVPESNKLYQGRMNAIGNVLGVIIGMFSQLI